MKNVSIALLLVAIFGAEMAVEGIKLGIVVSAEPPARTLENTEQTETEKENTRKEIEDAKKAELAKKRKELALAAKAAGDAVQAAADQEKAIQDQAIAKQKAIEAAWSKLPLSPDGLQHWPDGRVWYTPDKQQVNGINVYAQLD